MSSTNEQVKQRELLGAIATIYTASGWKVTDLHANKTNPVAMSGPDFLAIRDGVARAIKGLSKGGLSVPQTKMRDEYVATGIEWRTYLPQDFRQIAEDADGG